MITKASPLDVEVMFGKYFQDPDFEPDLYQKQLEQSVAAKKLSENLHTIDLIDLVATAIQFYNKLTVISDEMIKIDYIGKDFSEGERRRIVDTNLQNLLAYYKNERYVNSWILPETVEDLLVKITWLSFMQLPRYDPIDPELQASRFLNWKTFQFWSDSVEEHFYID